jgi:hypothetical protein
MDGFALSERWNGWTNLDVMVEAARAAVEAGPFDPLVCDVTLEWDDEEDTTLHSLGELQALLRSGAEPMTLDIVVAHGIVDEASLVINFNGRWLQINGYGTDWVRARQAYDAAQVELALEYGITTFRLPELPKDTVTEVRKRHGVKNQDPGREEEEAGLPDPGLGPEAA